MTEPDAPRVVRATASATPVVDVAAVGASAVLLASGAGPWTATTLVIDAHGALDAHVAGRDQVLGVVEGSAWLEVGGARFELARGDAGFVRKGELHAKGSDDGMVALAIQDGEIEP